MNRKDHFLQKESHLPNFAYILYFTNPLKIAQNSSTLVEGKKNAVFKRFHNRLKMFELHFSASILGKKKAHFRVENELFLHDFIANNPLENAKLQVRRWQTSPLTFANFPCYVCQLDQRSLLSRGFSIKTAPFRTHFRSIKKKPKRAVCLHFILSVLVQEV